MRSDLIVHPESLASPSSGGTRTINVVAREATEIRVLQPDSSRRFSRVLGPLRYPGAKRRLAPYVRSLLQANGIRPKLFVEPFAGGASVSLQLLTDDVVDSIGLADRDALVSSFWKVVFFDSDWLIGQVRSVDVTLSNWEYFKFRSHRTHRDRALACLFLNRTSYSGILAGRAGPIGGRSGKSDYSIDCRFPRATLEARIRQAASLQDRVKFVWQSDWRDTISRAVSASSTEVFFYLDPPFFYKADRLYNHCFGDSDHVALRDHVVRLRQPWLLSYDSRASVDRLYASYPVNVSQVELLYSASAKRSDRAAREVVVSNIDLLDPAKLWSKSRDRRS